MKTIFPTLLLATTISTSLHAAPQDVIILDELGVRNLRIETVEADYKDFETTVFAIGRIVDIPANRSVLSTRVAGRVVELDAFVGDTVRAGQRVAVIESRQPGDPPPQIELFAPRNGLVVSSHIQLGQPVEPSVELIEIVDRFTVWAVAQIPEEEAASVRAGTQATIRIPALGPERWDSVVSRLGVEADPRAGTVAAIFPLPNPDGRLQPGMRAEFSVVIDSRQGVLAIPREAVQGDPARRVVFVKDFELPHAFVRAPVVLGKQNERYVEVLEGLFPGDEVVTRGSYGLSFAGPGTGLSLKEALDAAHGHEHNEDGSEITPEQRAAQAQGSHLHDHDEDHHHGLTGSHFTDFLIAYGLVATLALLVTSQMLWNRRRSNPGKTPNEASKDA